MKNQPKDWREELPPRTVRQVMLDARINVDNVGGYTENIMGKVLTIVDASILDERQCKAMKDVIKQVVWDAYREIQDWSLEQTEEKQSSFPFSFTPRAERTMPEAR